MRADDLDDTDPEARRLQLDRLRSMTPLERAALADQLCAAVIDLSIAGARAMSPDATPGQLIREVTARRFGHDVAELAHGSTSTST